jgi:hypothetical protein
VSPQRVPSWLKRGLPAARDGGTAEWPSGRPARSRGRLVGFPGVGAVESRVQFCAGDLRAVFDCNGTANNSLEWTRPGRAQGVDLRPLAARRWLKRALPGRSARSR